MPIIVKVTMVYDFVPEVVTVVVRVVVRGAEVLPM